MRKSLKDFRGRVECIERSITSPNPAEPLSHNELAVAVCEIVRELEGFEKRLKVLEKKG